MIAFTLLFSLGCDSMPQAGNPFGQVELMAASGAAPVDATQALPVVDDEPKTMSSEEFFGQADVEQPEDAESSSDEAKVESGPTNAPETEIKPTVQQTAPSISSFTAPLPSENRASVVSSSGWPISVIKTLTELNPPRAILVFPSGEERVVKPGQLLSDHSLVVMGIGTKRVDLLRVSEQGDRAKLEWINLPTQN